MFLFFSLDGVEVGGPPSWLLRNMPQRRAVPRLPIEVLVLARSTVYFTTNESIDIPHPKIANLVVGDSVLPSVPFKEDISSFVSGIF